MIDTERYGGRRASFTHFMERGRAFLGVYSDLKDINWVLVRRLVFVCKGNICRSPYAEVRARMLGLNAVSLGLEASDGAAANPDAAMSAARRQVDLTAHRSRKLSCSEIEPSDLLIFFEPQHLLTYRKMAINSSASITLLGLWTNPKVPYISDPYGKSQRYFEECYAVIDSCVHSIASLISSG